MRQSRGVTERWAAALALGVWAATAHAGGDATAIMREVELRFRSQPRVIRLDVHTRRAPREDVVVLFDGEPIRIWGIQSGGGETTSVLYIFSAPRRMQGTGLLIRDPWHAQTPDFLGYRMRTFRRFQELPRSSLKLLVPGTCLTYEEARGFLSTEKYTFEPAGGRMPSGPEVVLLARPRDASLQQDLGIRSLRVTVDRKRYLVLRVETTGASGELTKVYEASNPVRVGEGWLPGSARVRDLQGAVVSELQWEYFPLPRLPDASLFDPLAEHPSLLDRFRAAASDFGIDISP